MSEILTYPYDAVLGDIGIIDGWIVTPNGVGPLQGAQWIVADRTETRTFMATSAATLGLILLCVPFIGWILAIPVMMSRSTAVTGCVEVTVLTRGLVHFLQIPVSSEQEILSVYAILQAVRGASRR